MVHRKQKMPSKIRLCVCTNIWIGLHSGAVDRILEFTKALSKQGVDVYIVDRSTQKSFSALLFDVDKYFKVENGALKEIPYPFYMRFLFPGIIKFVQGVFNMLFALLTMSNISEVCLFNSIDPHIIAKLFFVCKKEKINVIQCVFPFITLSSFLVKKIINVPIIYDALDIESERMKSMGNISPIYAAVVRRLEIASCKNCNLIFAVSEDDRRIMLSWNVDKEKIHLIPNSVDVAKFSPYVDGTEVRKRFNLANKFIIIFHGLFSYSPNKHAAELLANILLPRIVKENPNVFLLLVGKNPPKLSSPNVISAGFVKSTAEYIAAADLAVVPLMEGGGTKIKMLEYLAAGKAIVSTYKAAEGLDIENGKDLLMSRYPDQEFVELVLRCINDDDLRLRLASNARQKAELLYNWERNAKKAADIFTTLIEKS